MRVAGRAGDQGEAFRLAGRVNLALSFRGRGKRLGKQMMKQCRMVFCENAGEMEINSRCHWESFRNFGKAGMVLAAVCAHCNSVLFVSARAN